MHIDPIEKKPIIGWMPGSRILSFGSFGCNFHCGFCQNYEISLHVPYTTEMQPEEIVQWALDNGLPSIAYTYNEPTIFYEMMYDTAILAKGKGLKNVMVTNGFIEEEPLELILDYMDAMNIDLKTYSDEIYRRLGGRSVGHILGTIEKASQRCHVEVSILVVPDVSDDLVEMEHLFKKLSHINSSIILHISRYFPMYQYHQPATDIHVMRALKEIALKYFKRVNLGNVR